MILVGLVLAVVVLALVLAFDKRRDDRLLRERDQPAQPRGGNADDSNDALVAEVVMNALTNSGAAQNGDAPPPGHAHAPSSWVGGNLEHGGSHHGHDHGQSHGSTTGSSFDSGSSHHGSGFDSGSSHHGGGFDSGGGGFDGGSHGHGH